ncbi:MAG TPA: ankyrin repeat domain-containing protein [Planctomycetia bacterium]|nr:ankyrin repeat domain-containing protein [Planctomycetia bacterium]
MLDRDFLSLLAAAKAGETERVRELLDAGVDQNQHPGMPRGWTPLMEAAQNGSLETAQLLVERGALVNFEDGDGFTALTVAARYKHWKIVELLAESGGDVRHFDASGVSALRRAETNRKKKLLARLREIAGEPE